VTTARALIDRHGSTLSAERRRELGSHPTPEPLARVLVEVAIDHLGHVPGLVVDPSCGAGSFLLAAADALVERGVPPAEVPGRLAGCDADPAAVVHCREALRRWSAERGVTDLAAGDVRILDPLAEATPWGGRVDLVVGNPPFLAQRTSDTARDDAARDGLQRRFGVLGPYTDTSAAFLLVASELLDAEGVAVMIQPQSFLAARDSEAVRDLLSTRTRLVALWADDGRHFDAEVDVCAPVLRRTATTEHRVQLRWGPTARLIGHGSLPLPGTSWAPLLAAGLGLPDDDGGTASSDDVGDRSTLGDVATTAAGFRDEFYALAAAARSCGDAGWSARAAPLVTVGMVDVARIDRRTPRRFGGRRVSDPRLDRRALRRDAPRVAEWVRRRAVPKVLVATQTKVIEAAADPTGRLVPVTPVVSVEPRPDSGIDVWDVLAVLSAPPVALDVARSAAGSGLSTRAVRVSAAGLRSVALPLAVDAWRVGALRARELQGAPPHARREGLRRLGESMCIAYGVDPAGQVLDWWLSHAERV